MHHQEYNQSSHKYSLRSAVLYKEKTKKRIKLCSKNTDFMRFIVRLSQSSSPKWRVYLPYLDLM